MTFVSIYVILCRMFINYKEALRGFSKNIMAVFSNNPIITDCDIWLLLDLPGQFYSYIFPFSG